MTDRIAQELELLKKDYPNLEFREEGQWVLLPEYTLATDLWNKAVLPVCFQIPPAYPGEPPYGFCVQTDLVTKGAGEKPANAYAEPANTPFEGTWGKFSWQQDNSWHPTADLKSGSNLLDFVRTFQDRFKEGK